jgi:hypothetical protein
MRRSSDATASFRVGLILGALTACAWWLALGFETGLYRIFGLIGAVGLSLGLTMGAVGQDATREEEVERP